MGVSLHVNVDHVATLRQARGGRDPDPVWAATLAELGGAAGITVHLREDRRHIQDRDLEMLRQTVRGVLNLEIGAVPEAIDKAIAVRPDMVTLVPEKRNERTTEGGLDLTGRDQLAIREAVAAFLEAKMTVSLFVDPDIQRVRAANELRVQVVELNTGLLAEAMPLGFNHPRVAEELEHLAKAASEARRLGMRAAAGHGLDYSNVEAVVRVPCIEDLSIGHAIIARSVHIGITQAVRDMIALIRSAE